MHFVSGGISREFGIFAQMYKKMIQEHNVVVFFYVQCVIKKKKKMGMKLAQF